MNKGRFYILFETESGITDRVYVDNEADIRPVLEKMLKGYWNRLIAGDTIRIIEETSNG